MLILEKVLEIILNKTYYYLLSIYYGFVTGLGDEKDMITPPEINHLQEPDWNCTGRCRREAFRMVDNRRPET